MMSESTLPAGNKQRGFGHGGLRLVLLSLINEQSRHGYDLIKAVEELTSGHYRPSAGMVYPLLNQLVEQGLLSAEAAAGEESKKQVYAIQPAGQKVLADEAARIEHIFARVRQRAKQPIQVTRAIENFKLAVRLKLGNEVLTTAQANQLTEILDNAVRQIEQL